MRNGSRSPRSGLGQSRRFRRRLLLLALALLERIEVIENVVPHFLEVFGDLGAGVFFLQLLDHSVDQHRSRFLLEVIHFARQLARKRKRAAVDNGELLPELIVFPLQLLGGRVFELPVLHHFRDFLDGHHLSFEYRENFRQSYGAHLHASQRELFARDSPREIVHQFLFAHGEPLDDASFLPLERLAFEHLRNTPAQKIDSRFHFLLKRVRQASRQRQQSRPV